MDINETYLEEAQFMARQKFEQIKNLEAGESLWITELFEIYRYMDGECLVICYDDEELAAMLIDTENKDFIYELL